MAILTNESAERGFRTRVGSIPQGHSASGPAFKKYFGFQSWLRCDALACA